MNIKVIFGILLAVVLVHATPVNGKSYSGSSVNIQGVTEDVSSMSNDSKSKTTVKVAPYPYIPYLDGDNHQNLLKYIKDEFEKRYLIVRLVLRAMDVFDSFYKVVEVDTILLGDLVDAGVAAPQYMLMLIYFVRFFSLLEMSRWQHQRRSTITITISSSRESQFKLRYKFPVL